MSLIDEIRENAKNDSPRSWRFVETVSDDGQEWFGCGVAEETCDEFVWFDHDPEQDIPRARRIAAVPSMEAALLAAEELAGAVDGLHYATGLSSLRLTQALSAFREACK